MARLVATLDEVELTRTKAGARHILRVPAVRELAADRQLLSIARDWVGAAAFPFRATLFDKSLSANWLVSWHQDTALPVRTRADHPHWGPWSMKAGVLHAIAAASTLQ